MSTTTNQTIYTKMREVHNQLQGLDYQEGLKVIKRAFKSAYEADNYDDKKTMVNDSYVKIGRKDFTCLESWFCYTQEINVNEPEYNPFGFWNTLINNIHHS